MRKCFTRLVGVTATAVGCLVVSGAVRADLLIGDFEGNMESPFTVNQPADPAQGWIEGPPGTVRANWFTDTGITVPSQIISTSDPDYIAGVTHGTHALKFTYPKDWGSIDDPYLRLHGQEQLMDAVLDNTVLAFDVTTLGGVDTPDEGPDYRQVFPVFNMSVPALGGDIFYDANYDPDVQREIDIPDYDQAYTTYTVRLRLDGSIDPEVQPFDDAVPLHAYAQYIKDDHEDGTPISNYHFQLVLVFQGQDTPSTDQISVIIDNIRFITSAVEGLAGDYNNDGVVDARDYVTWRDAMTAGMTSLPNETQSIGVLDEADFFEWRNNYGATVAGAGAGVGSAAAVPEPSSILLAFGALVGLVATARRMR
jgi:hypothetical protein